MLSSPITGTPFFSQCFAGWHASHHHHLHPFAVPLISISISIEMLRRRNPLAASAFNATENAVEAVLCYVVLPVLVLLLLLLLPLLLLLLLRGRKVVSFLSPCELAMSDRKRERRECLHQHHDLLILIGITPSSLSSASPHRQNHK